MNRRKLKVLLIEDDEDDYVLVRGLLAEASTSKFELDWVSGYDEALEVIERNQHDVYLLDYRLGEHNGLELLEQLTLNGCSAPIIFLTGQGDYEVDVEAMKKGAADYLVKGQINSDVLERSIRYSMERKRSEAALRESERQLKLLSSQLLTVQENERKRIASELHDSLGQILTAIKFGVENTLNMMRLGTATPQILESLVPTIQYAIEEVRKMYTNLRPSLLDDLGILATIGWFCREFEKVYTGIRVEKDIEVREEDVPEPLKVVIYRILQESFNNIAKHSKADLVQISLSRSNCTIELAIQDNGRGFDLKRALVEKDFDRGLGLASMRERTELSGGSMSIESIEGTGTTITAEWPLSEFCMS